MAAPTVAAPTFEHHHDGLGLGYAKPRISWQFGTTPDTAPSWMQTDYDIEVTWSATGEVENFSGQSDESVLVPWPARALNSREAAKVRVRCHGTGIVSGSEAASTTGWSEASEVEVGFLSKENWKASFITSSKRIGPDGPLQPLRFRREFELSSKGGISRARLYLTAMGVCQAYINGKPTSDELMAPGWTSYQHRHNYRVHDVSSLLNPNGENVIAIEVSEGWYCGVLGVRGGTRFIYGDRLAVLAQLEIDADDGTSTQVLTSDNGNWSCTGSAIKLSEIYNGEIYDARTDDHSWNQTGAGWRDDGWISVTKVPWPSAELVAPDAPPVRVTEMIEVKEVFKSKSGQTILDFGQNLVGRVQIRQLDLPSGGELSLRHAEVMENGELGTRPLRLAKATDIITSAGETIRDWVPQFTFHGFRYVQVDGWPGDGSLPPKENFVAQVMHTDMRRRGYFSCSNSSVNQLYKNVAWSMRGNFLSVPTDCPQRNERLGWTGDIQVFGPTANFMFDSVGMLKDWLQDLASEQLEEGQDGVPAFICPGIPLQGWPASMPAAIWDDVVVLTPYDLYKSGRDEEILSRQFTSMQAWLKQGVDRGSDGLWNPDRWQLGDWLDPIAPPNDPSNGPSDPLLIADAYLIHTTETFVRICEILRKHELLEKYSDQVRQLRERFQHKYITPAGNLMSNTQTGLALAIQYSLYRNGQELGQARDQLVKLTRRARFNIATGFAGTPVIAHALTKVKQSQFAYRMLLEKTCPSWLYPVTMGATTIWERWDSMLPNGSINPGTMTSFNHYALGAIADWLHTTVGGISPAETWKTFLVRPVPGGNITSADVSFSGPYGLIQCSWQLEGNIFSMSLTVPPNSTAKVILPSAIQEPIGTEEDFAILKSGVHHLRCEFYPAEWPPKPIIAPHVQPPAEFIA